MEIGNNHISIDFVLFSFFFQIHDVAEFLGGELKTKNQHIRLEYKKTFKAASSPQQAVSFPSVEINATCKLAAQASILSTSPVLSHDALEINLEKPLSVQRKGCVHGAVSKPLASQSLSAQTSTRHLSASNPDLRTIDHCNTKGLLKGSSRRPLPPPPLGVEGQSVLGNSNERPQLHSLDYEQTKRPASPRRQQTNKHQKDLDLDSSSSSAELELSYTQSSYSFQRQHSADMSSCYRAPSSGATSPLGRGRCDSDVSESTDSFVDLRNLDAERSESVAKVEMTEVHLYILRENSPMFLHLRSTWNNCILVSKYCQGTYFYLLTNFTLIIQNIFGEN